MKWYYIRAYKEKLTYYGYILAKDEKQSAEIFNKYCPEPEIKRCEVKCAVPDDEILSVITSFGDPNRCNPRPILSHHWKPFNISKPINVIYSVDFDKYVNNYDAKGTEGDAFVNAERIVLPSTEEYRKLNKH